MPAAVRPAYLAYALTFVLLSQCYYKFPSFDPEINTVTSGCVYEPAVIRGKYFGSEKESNELIFSSEEHEWKLHGRHDSISRWHDNEIKFELPFNMAGDSGDLYVVVDGRASNAVPFAPVGPRIDTVTPEKVCVEDKLEVQIHGQCLGDDTVEAEEIIIEGVSHGEILRLESSLSFIVDQSESIPDSTPTDRTRNISIYLERDGSNTPRSNAVQVDILPGEWHQSVDLDGDDFFYFRHEILSHDGSPVNAASLVYRHQDGDIRHEIQRDGSKCWKEKTLSLPGDSSYRVFHVDDSLHVTYAASSGETYQCGYKSFDGMSGAWKDMPGMPDYQCTSTPGLVPVTLSGSGRGYLLYWLKQKIFYSIFNADDEAWLGPDFVLYDPEICTNDLEDLSDCWAKYPDMAKGVNNEVFLVFTENVRYRDIISELHFAVSEDSASTWRRIEDPFETRSGYPVMKTGKDGSIHLAYIEQPGGIGPHSIVYTSSGNGGNTWEAPEVIADNVIANEEMTPIHDLFVPDSTSGSHVAVLWRAMDELEQEGDLKIRVKHAGAEEFGEPIIGQFLCQDETMSFTRILGISGNGTIVYATINEYPLFGSLAFNGTIDAHGLDDDMVFVPGGCSVLGTDEYLNDDEYPRRNIFLSPFYIDKYEVTNREYIECESEGECSPPMDSCLVGEFSIYYGFEYNTYYDYPVVCVTWQQAADYCSSKDKCLPTEAQWEKAAGGARGNKYPWGDTMPNKDLANINGEYSGHKKPVKELEGGKSPVGAYNMTGNVSEWVFDWYYNDYFRNITDIINPSGPEDETEKKVIKGGHSNSMVNDGRVAARDSADPSQASIDVGFRCVKPAEGASCP